MAFGYLLRRFRLEKGFSQNRLAEIVGVDHGHINRLEIGLKSPSGEMVQKLADGLGLNGRDAWLLGYVAQYREYVDVEMIEYALAHPDITEKEFNWAVGIKFRMPDLDYPRLFDCTRLMIEVAEDFLSHWTSPSKDSTPNHFR